MGSCHALYGRPMVISMKDDTCHELHRHAAPIPRYYQAQRHEVLTDVESGPCRVLPQDTDSRRDLDGHCSRSAYAPPPSQLLEQQWLRFQFCNILYMISDILPDGDVDDFIVGLLLDKWILLK